MSITLLQGDNRTLLPTLAERSVQTVITSPPYWGLRDYGVAGQIGLEATIGEYVAELVNVFALVWRVLRDDGTLWLNLGDAYANDAKWGGASSGKHVQALHGNTGIGRRRTQTGLRSKNLMGLPWRVAFALQDAGWILRSEIIWHKPNVMPESVTDRPTRDHEHLFLFAKNEQYYYDQDAIRQPQTGNAHSRGRGVTPKSASGSHETIKANESFHRATSAYVEVPGGRNRRTVWSVASQAYAGAHYATFPEKLVEPCILAGSSAQACPHCGAAWERVIESTGHTNKRETAHQPGRSSSTKTDSTNWAPTSRPTSAFVPGYSCPDNDGSAASTVLDPFAGTFTVGRVATRYGRNAVGIELSPDYAELGIERTDKVQIEMFV